MTVEAVAFLGCSRGGLLDIWNCARTLSYVRSHSTSASRINGGCCPDTGSLLPVGVGGPYTNPVDDDAWWYDVFRPESAGFLGLQVTKVTGMDADSIDVTSYATARCDNGIGYERTVYKGATITVEGILHGLTCCAVAYGLRALRKQLLGCCDDNQCTGTQLRFLNCIPDPAPPACGTWLPPAETTSPWRTLTNVKVVELPSIVSGSGASCGACGCKQMTKVMFTLRSNSELYLDERVVLPATVLLSQAPGACISTICDDAGACDELPFLADPDCDLPILVPPADASSNCFCPPIFSKQQCLSLDLGTRMFDSDMEVEIYSGSTALRNLEVRIWRQIGNNPYDPNLYNACNVCNGFTVSYVPRATTFVRDMCGSTVRRGTLREQATSVFAGLGGRFADSCLRLACGRYIICIIADGVATANDATIELRVREFEP